MNEDFEHPDWIEFDSVIERAQELINRLPDSLKKNNAYTRCVEMAYWFNEAHIEAHQALTDYLKPCPCCGSALGCYCHEYPHPDKPECPGNYSQEEQAK